MNRKLVVNDLTFKGVLLLAIISLGLLVGGCSWFAWLPGVGDGGSKDDEESSEPIKLEKFIAEADVRVIWKRSWSRVRKKIRSINTERRRGQDSSC